MTSEPTLRNFLSVMASGSAEPALDFVAAAFENDTGHAVKITYNEAVVVFDVLVATSDAVQRKYRPAGVVEEGGIGIGRTGLGITVRSGAPSPAIAGIEAFKRAFFETDAILLTTHTSGIYIEDLLKKMDIYEQVQAKIKRFHKAPELMDRLLGGKGKELSVLSLNQIRRYQEKGLSLVGPLPDEVQDYREFIAVPAVKSTNKEVARQFVSYCGGQGKPLLLANGFI